MVQHIATAYRRLELRHDSRQKERSRGPRIKSDGACAFAPYLYHDCLPQQSGSSMMASGNERHKRLTLEYLFDSQKCYPILDALTLSLSLADCLVLCQVSRAFQQFSEFLRRRHLNIDLHLEDFVSKPKLFRSQLGKHRALISGVFALRFFELGRSKAPCLDVFIESGFHEKEFQKYLQAEEGASYTGCTSMSSRSRFRSWLVVVLIDGR